MPEVTTNDGVRLHYEEKCEGKSLVSIHGWTYIGEAIPGVQTVFFEESGHALFFDEPRRFDDTVARFVAGSGLCA